MGAPLVDLEPTEFDVTGALAVGDVGGLAKKDAVVLAKRVPVVWLQSTLVAHPSQQPFVESPRWSKA